jgi:hypothetical protein
MIEDWDAPDFTSVKIMGYCSWCFQKTNHSLRSTSLIFRNAFVCDDCGGHTATCISCGQAFTRCSSLHNELTCAKCFGLVADWDEVAVNLKKMQELGRYARRNIDICQSFAPIRKNQWVRPLIDAKECFSAMADAMELARETIYLSFWQFSYFVVLWLCVHIHSV